MKLNDKRAMLAYLENHNDNSETATRLINLMKNEVNYADCDTHSVGKDDLDYLSETAQAKLRKYFGKAEGEDWTLDECEDVAEKLADFIGDDYGDDLHNVIEFEF